ncbi:MAG TPA: hypothetical protein DEB40_10365 [Elusimicrobia bacterium]|nr:hypothetical protein [Elusimicrobiota bacterium]HBT62133.1 hypothetical protein [Elusimicrobiota bacterium]
MLLLGLAVAWGGCAGVESRVRSGAIGEVIDQKPDRGGFIEAIGIGGSDSALPSVTQRKALARDAAIVKAQYELLSMVKGVTLEGGVTVSRALETDSGLEARVHAAIRGAEVRKTEFTSDNGCVVTLRLPRNRLEKLMGVEFQ